MPRRPRLLLWSATILTLVLLLSLLLSSRFALLISTSAGYELSLVAGWIQASHFEQEQFLSPVVPGLRCGVIPWQLKWNFAFDHDSTGWLLNIPLWCPLLLSASATAFLWRRSRHLPGHCPQCRYNLQALPPSSNGKVSCPECGNSVTSAPVAPQSLE